MSTVPERPILRSLETQWTEQAGQPVLILRDPLGLTDRVAMVRPQVAVLLSLCDGTRDVNALRAALELRAGIPLSPARIRRLLEDLDEAMLFEGERVEEARQAAVSRYLSLDSRVPALAGETYPADADACRAALAGYAPSGRDDSRVPSSRRIVGVVSPHIDYQRGGAVYHQAWSAASTAVRDAELVIVLGTDHHGSAGRITLTRQRYATPFGTLPLDTGVIGDVLRAVGSEFALGEELHHIGEHSIELAAVWMHSHLNGRLPRVVPILCGSFHEFVAGAKHPRHDQRMQAAIDVLRSAMRGRRCLVVAAADLSHIGPAFGDAAPVDQAGLSEVARADGDALAAVRRGDADGFLESIKSNEDRFRVCGLPPIYLALRLLEGSRGRVLDYQACPADPERGSWVTIAGAVLSDVVSSPSTDSESGGATSR